MQFSLEANQLMTLMEEARGVNVNVKERFLVHLGDSHREELILKLLVELKASNTIANTNQNSTGAR